MRGVVPVVSLLLLSSLALVPGADAGLPTCRNAATASAEGHHAILNHIRSSLWKESNGYPGLQTTSCETADGRTFAKDTLLASGLPQDLGILGICFGLGVAYQCA